MGGPVMLPDTGFSGFLAAGTGLLPYRTREGAIAAMRQLRADYEGHCRAARAVAEAHFDARGVLTSLLERSL